jgi:hypothetical protein
MVSRTERERVIMKSGRNSDVLTQFLYFLCSPQKILHCIIIRNKMRQTKLSEYANGAHPPRVTRGNSDLPKDEPKPDESESSSEEE